LVDIGRRKPTIQVQRPSPGIEKTAVTQPKPSAVRVNVDLPAQQSACAFRRNHEDLRPFTRAFYSQYHRYPMGDEALEWLHANGRYSGEWEDREDRRAKRVQQILNFLEPDFDPEKLGSGQPSVSLELGRFRWWVEQKFGLTMVVDVKDRSRCQITTTATGGSFDAITVQAPTSTVAVPAKFVDHCLTVVEFCIRTDPLSNEAVPTNRIKKIWAMVKNGAAWNQKWYQAVRDKLHRMGVIRIFDRKHSIGKAWRWMIGKNMPSGTWKEDQRRFREEHQLPAELAKTFEEIIADTGNREELQHNTLYHDESQISAVSVPEQQVRPPPWSI
jgi:hypothetical protein